ncbi:Hypothetical predicted protein [Marmota monax]|uniref:Uncharacterized protein n=1 Tax=Marmota monax TaxID=9995 RepID=A0A5E4AX59_MARMO|nr:hypothetical protein GHT09_015172 [Marmota monax]VTJ61119.1 Hypothetical predicted protein [Marmota monax]
MMAPGSPILPVPLPRASFVPRPAQAQDEEVPDAGRRCRRKEEGGRKEGSAAGTQPAQGWWTEVTEDPSMDILQTVVDCPECHRILQSCDLGQWFSDSENHVLVLSAQPQASASFGSCPILGSCPHSEVDSSSLATYGHHCGLEGHLKIEVATHCSRRTCPSLDCVLAMVMVMGVLSSVSPFWLLLGAQSGPGVPPSAWVEAGWALGGLGVWVCEGFYPGEWDASLQLVVGSETLHSPSPPSVWPPCPGGATREAPGLGLCGKPLVLLVLGSGTAALGEPERRPVGLPPLFPGIELVAGEDLDAKDDGRGLGQALGTWVLESCGPGVPVLVRHRISEYGGGSTQDLGLLGGSRCSGLAAGFGLVQGSLLPTFTTELLAGLLP